jgi:hypothetical protein
VNLNSAVKRVGSTYPFEMDRKSGKNLKRGAVGAIDDFSSNFNALAYQLRFLGYVVAV